MRFPLGRRCAETLPGTAGHPGPWTLTAVRLVCSSLPTPSKLRTSLRGVSCLPRLTVVHSASSSGGRAAAAGAGAAVRATRGAAVAAARRLGPAPVRSKRSRGRVGGSGALSLGRSGQLPAGILLFLSTSRWPARR